jgi:hypothetical protein
MKNIDDSLVMLRLLSMGLFETTDETKKPGERDLKKSRMKKGNERHKRG